jgi:hypothetical protein
MVPCTGLGAVMEFSGSELRAYAKHKEDPTCDVKKLLVYLRCVRKVREKNQQMNPEKEYRAANHTFWPYLRPLRRRDS